jgi:hypothetical protein
MKASSKGGLLSLITGYGEQYGSYKHISCKIWYCCKHLLEVSKIGEYSYQLYFLCVLDYLTSIDRSELYYNYKLCSRLLFCALRFDDF